jgi:hypothetical protein
MPILAGAKVGKTICEWVRFWLWKPCPASQVYTVKGITAKLGSFEKNSLTTEIPEVHGNDMADSPVCFRRVLELSKCYIQF